MSKSKLKTLGLSVFLVALCLLPQVSWAASAETSSVFDIISSKMIQTVMDVREIVYVIAGFGLIMFAVLAVFNKISFKHLAYICIGLFLLAVMMPFINYFSGANLTDSKLNYGNLIDPNNASVVGSDITEDGVKSEGQESLPDLRELEKQLQNGIEGDYDDDLAALVDGVTIDENEPCDGARVRTTGGKLKCCKNGANATGTGCKVTLDDVVGAVQQSIEAGQDVLQAGQSGLSSAERAKQAIEDAVSGLESLGDIWKNRDNGVLGFLDMLGHLGDSLQQTADAVGTDFNKGLSNAEDAMDALSELGKDVTGNKDNNFSEQLDNSGYHDFVDQAQQKTKDDRGGIIQDVGQAGEDLGRMGDDIKGLDNQIDDLKNWFDK